MSDDDVGPLRSRFIDILDTAFTGKRNPIDFVAAADAFLQDIKRLPPHILEEVGDLGERYPRYFAVPRVDAKKLPSESDSEATPNIRLQFALDKLRPSLQNIHGWLIPTATGRIRDSDVAMNIARIRLVGPFLACRVTLTGIPIHELIERICIWASHPRYVVTALKLLNKLRSWTPEPAIDDLLPIFCLMRWSTDDREIKPTRRHYILFNWVVGHCGKDDGLHRSVYLKWCIPVLSMGTEEWHVRVGEWLLAEVSIPHRKEWARQGAIDEEREAEVQYSLNTMYGLCWPYPHEAFPSHEHAWNYARLLNRTTKACVRPGDPRPIEPQLDRIVSLYHADSCHCKLFRILAFMFHRATSPQVSTLFFHRAHGLVGYALTQDMGECATEVIVTILRRCAADGTFERTKFPYTLSHYPALLRSKKFKDIVAADWFDRFRNMPDEPTWNSDKPIDLLHLVVIHNGLMGTTKHLGWDYVDTFLRTAKTSFEIILRNEHLRMPTKLDLKKLGVTTPPPDASDVDVDADMESLSETDDGVGEVMTCQSPPTLDDNQGSFNFLRLGLHTTPMTSVSEFVREIPAPYQPIELVIEGNKSADFPGLLMGDLLGISPSGCNMEGHVLDCPFQLGLNAMTGTHRLEIRRARNAANYYGTSHWRCRVIFDAVSEGYRQGMTEIDYAVSNQFLTFISDPMIGLFREAYDPVLKCPRVFTPEVRAITWIMLETSSRKRPGRWEAIFRNPHNPSTKRGPRPHVDSVCSFHPIYPNIDKIGDDDGPRYRLRAAQFGEYCGRVIAHGCGLGSPAHPIQLSESLVSASAFQEGLGRTCNVASLLRLFEVRELGTLLASRQRWYPGDLL